MEKTAELIVEPWGIETWAERTWVVTPTRMAARSRAQALWVHFVRFMKILLEIEIRLLIPEPLKIKPRFLETDDILAHSALRSQVKLFIINNI
jgi:hypothetical protein